MKTHLKEIVVTMLFVGSMSSVYASEVCHQFSGGVNCGKGTMENVSGNGIVKINGTTVTGATMANGSFSAMDADLFSLDINGSANLSGCLVHAQSSIKGTLTASSTTFDNGLTMYSSITKLIKSKVNGDLRIPHINQKKPVVYLENGSEVTGNVIFDDAQGTVFVRGKSKIGGKVVGGERSV